MRRMCICAAMAVSLVCITVSNALGGWASGMGPDPGRTNDFPCVGKIGRPNPNDPNLDSFDCSGTVVGNGMFVLTARHCVTTDGTITGPVMNAADFRFQMGDVGSGNPVYRAASIIAHPNADIAVVKLRDVMFPDAYQLYCPPTNAPPEDGISVCGVGFGRGSSAGGTSTSLWDLPYGNKRVFYNLVDSVGPGPLAGQGRVINISITIPGGVNGEGGAGPGDSGGPLFINDGTGLKIGGVISSGTGPGPRPGTTTEAVSVRDYKDWIMAQIPSPTTATVLAMLGLVACRRRRP